MELLKTVLHVHTDYSDDSDNEIAHLIESAGQLGVDCLAVTDHDSIEGAQILAAEAGPELEVIVGEEISTPDGHLIGLFLQKHVEPGMSPRRTAEAIKEQGGLVVVPHPFNSMFSCGLRGALFDLVDLIDIVEISNAQNLLPFPNRRAARFAQTYGLPGLVGADTHHQNSLDACYQWLPPFDGPGSFLGSIARARLVAGRHRLSYFVRTALYIARYQLGFGFPSRYGRNCNVLRGQTTPQPVPVPVKS